MGPKQGKPRMDGIPKLGITTFFFWGVIMGCPPMVYAMQAIWARAKRLRGFGLREYGGHQLDGCMLWLVVLAIGYMAMAIDYWQLVIGYLPMVMAMAIGKGYWLLGYGY